MQQTIERYAVTEYAEGYALTGRGAALLDATFCHQKTKFVAASGGCRLATKLFRLENGCQQIDYLFVI